MNGNVPFKEREVIVLEHGNEAVRVHGQELGRLEHGRAEVHEHEFIIDLLDLEHPRDWAIRQWRYKRVSLFELFKSLVTRDLPARQGWLIRFAYSLRLMASGEASGERLSN